jgi:hypothetical protein
MRRIVLTLSLGLTVAAAAAADWLVMKDGGLVETRGEWKVKGPTVVFTTPNGTLSSVRLSEVDLDASAQATYEAKNPPAGRDEAAEEETETARDAVIEITDDDIKRAPVRSGEGDGGGGDAAAGSSANKEDVPINEPFELLTWNVTPSERGLEIVGTLAYRGEEQIVDGLNMIVRLQSPDGTTLSETSASLRTRMLRTGAATSFRAVFTDVDTEDYRVAVEVESREGREL